MTNISISQFNVETEKKYNDSHVNEHQRKEAEGRTMGRR